MDCFFIPAKRASPPLPIPFPQGGEGEERKFSTELSKNHKSSKPEMVFKEFILLSFPEKGVKTLDNFSCQSS